MAVYVFDVNETLSDLAPMRTRFAEVGLPPTAAQLWFTTLLRDGIGVAAAGGLVRFADAARGVLAPMLPGDPDAVEHVLTGFQALLLLVGGLYALAFLLARRFRFLADRQLVDDRTDPLGSTPGGAEVVGAS